MLDHSTMHGDHGSNPNNAGDSRAIRILAKSVYRELRSSGHSRTDVVRFTNELLDLMASEMRESTEPPLLAVSEERVTA